MAAKERPNPLLLRPTQTSEHEQKAKILRNKQQGQEDVRTGGNYEMASVITLNFTLGRSRAMKKRLQGDENSLGLGPE